MRKLIFGVFAIIFLILVLNPVISQKVAVELSITWERSCTQLPESLFHYIKINYEPYLQVKYKNMSSEDLFFLKPVRNYDNLPQLLCDELVGGQSIDEIVQNLPYNTHFNDTFDVKIIGIYEYSNSEWRIITNTTNSSYTSKDKANRDISSFYNALHNTLSIDKIDNQAHYSTYYKFENLPIQYTDNSSVQSFIFLKQGQEYIERFNLIGFMLHGGYYRFEISENKLSDYLLVSLKSAPLIPIEYSIPKKVEEYNLYKDNFISNSVSIKFSNVFGNSGAN